MSVVEQLQLLAPHLARVASTHLQPHDLLIGLCVTASATTPFGVSVVEQLQLLAPHLARVASTHLQPHDLLIGLCVTASATTPFGVSVVEQLQLLALHSAVIASHAHPQSLPHGEMVLDIPFSEHEQLTAPQVTVILTVVFRPEATSMT